MKDKLREYVDTIFADAERKAPDHRRLAELKEEILQNLCDKYDDLIASGKSPAAAYNIAVAGVGDISDLLDAVSGTDAHTPPAGSEAKATPTAKATTYRVKTWLTPEEQELMRRYRERSAILTAIAVAMYILCVVPVILIEHILGVAVMFCMIAAATGLIIFNAMTKPKLGKNAASAGDDDEGDEDEEDDGNDEPDAEYAHAPRRPRRSPVYKAISGAIWTLTVCTYLLVSFATGYWHITWMIFLIATAVDNIIKAIFDLRR